MTTSIIVSTNSSDEAIKRLNLGFFLTFYIKIYVFFLEACRDPERSLTSCCRPETPCGEGGGDCDHDDDCAGNLVCGFDNCVDYDASWPMTYDCCMPGKFKRVENLLVTIINF